jgi:hypothetical protein
MPGIKDTFLEIAAIARSTLQKTHAGVVCQDLTTEAIQPPSDTKLPAMGYR